MSGLVGRHGRLRVYIGIEVTFSLNLHHRLATPFPATLHLGKAGRCGLTSDTAVCHHLRKCRPNVEKLKSLTSSGAILFLSTVKSRHDYEPKTAVLIIVPSLGHCCYPALTFFGSRRTRDVAKPGSLVVGRLMDEVPKEDYRDASHSSSGNI